MSIVLSLLHTVLWLFWLVLMARLVLSYVVLLARDWRPRGAALVVAEGICTITDPPLHALRKVIPPLRLGGISLDLAFLVLLLLVVVLMQSIPRV